MMRHSPKLSQSMTFHEFCTYLWREGRREGEKGGREEVRREDERR